MKKIENIVFGGGCFWCIEAIIQRLKGVIEIKPGYAGSNSNQIPTYEKVCEGNTGFAEVVKVTFDTNEVSLENLITIFMTSHDPTTLNRQGADVGSQYRSIILYDNTNQEATAKQVFEQLKTNFDKPIVTELALLKKFYNAEPYHEAYYNKNSEAGYCQMVINPKIAKLRKMYASKLKN